MCYAVLLSRRWDCGNEALYRYLLEELRKVKTNIIKQSVFSAKLWTQDSAHTKQDCRLLTCDIGFTNAAENYNKKAQPTDMEPGTSLQNVVY
jgi:hypothetical protein